MDNIRRETRRRRIQRIRRQDVGQGMRIDLFPDDILLDVFDFYTSVYPAYEKTRVEGWQSLVHVCQRWRSLVLRSPRRLNLQLYCTPRTPAKYTLDVWPALPLIVAGNMTFASDTDNVVAALGQHNRVCQISLRYLVSRQLEEVLAAMQVPFPELTELQFVSNGETLLSESVIPDSFLNGSAPRLQIFELRGIPFPAMPRLLLSATYLVYLRLVNIPHSGYIPPEAIVALLSVLSSLEALTLTFHSPQSCPGQESRCLPPSRRSVVPALCTFIYKGVIEYLEDLVTCIDTPQLDVLDINFFNQIDFDIPQLAQFINRTPKLTNPDAYVRFDDNSARVGLSLEYRTLGIVIPCREPDWQLSSIEQLCNSSLNSLSTVEDLYIEHRYRQSGWKNDALENTLWLQLLLPFTGVENIYLTKQSAPGIAAALQELIGSRIMEVLPGLQNIFVNGLDEPSGPFQENIAEFVAARQLFGHTITISDWDEDFDLVSTT